MRRAVDPDGDLGDLETWSRRQFNAAGAKSLIAARVFPWIPNTERSYALQLDRTDDSEVKMMHARQWEGDNDRSLQALGNGRAMIHERGPDIVSFRAPWISSPNLLTMSLAESPGLSARSSREVGTAIWHHQLSDRSGAFASIIDALDAEKPCLRRLVRTRSSLRFVLRSHHPVQDGKRYPGSIVLSSTVPYGTTIYGDFKSADPFTLFVILPGGAECEIRKAEETHGSDAPLPWENVVRLPAGEHAIVVVVGENLGACVELADKVWRIDGKLALESSRSQWRWRLRSLQIPRPGKNDSIDLAEISDDVSTLLLSHQSSGGSICAGQIYPLFYVRDQYGVSKALLRLGLHADAQAIMNYYFHIWSRYGRIENAQSDGPRHWFHRAENDRVEMTGYLVLQAFETFDATQDNDWLRSLFPMLQWAMDAQRDEVSEDVLPFNGDETYVAGGMFPREHLNDGSSESTLLYIASAARYLPWAENNGLLKAEQATLHRSTVERVRKAYSINFVADGKLRVNKPRLWKPEQLPRFRYGVCLGRYDEHCLFLADTEIGEDTRYFCQNCYPRRDDRPYRPSAYELASVELTSVLIGSDVIEPQLIVSGLRAQTSTLVQNGQFRLPSGPLPGYELAVITLALARTHSPFLAQFRSAVISLRDSVGAWSEYYRNAAPEGCRCRPWESALSLYALLESADAEAVHTGKNGGN